MADNLVIFKKFQRPVDRRQICGVLRNFFPDICGGKETVHSPDDLEYFDPLRGSHDFSATQNVCFVKFSHDARVA